MRGTRWTRSARCSAKSARPLATPWTWNTSLVVRGGAALACPHDAMRVHLPGVASLLVCKVMSRRKPVVLNSMFVSDAGPGVSLTSITPSAANYAANPKAGVAVISIAVNQAGQPSGTILPIFPTTRPDGLPILISSTHAGTPGENVASYRSLRFNCETTQRTLCSRMPPLLRSRTLMVRTR